MVQGVHLGTPAIVGLEWCGGSRSAVLAQDAWRDAALDGQAAFLAGSERLGNESTPPAVPRGRSGHEVAPTPTGRRVLRAIFRVQPVWRAVGGERQVLLKISVGRLRVEVDVVDAGVALPREEAWNPRIRVTESPDGKGDASGYCEACLQHLRVFVGLRHRREVIRRYLSR